MQNMERHHSKKTVSVTETGTFFSAEPISEIVPNEAAAQESERIFQLISQEKALRRRVEKALQESEERYKQLFTANPSPIFVYDIDSLRILAINQAGIRAYGYSENEFLSLRLSEIIQFHPYESNEPEEAPQPQKNEAISELPDVFTTEEVDETFWDTCRIVTKQGECIDAEVMSCAIRFVGRSARLLVTNDISERIYFQNFEKKVIHEQRILMEKIQSAIFTIEHYDDWQKSQWTCKNNQAIELMRDCGSNVEKLKVGEKFALTEFVSLQVADKIFSILGNKFFIAKKLKQRTIIIRTPQLEKIEKISAEFYDIGGEQILFVESTKRV